MFAIVLALSAALTYGAADFLGGIASRRTPPASVVAFSQLGGIGVLALAWPALPSQRAVDGLDLALGVAIGVAGGVGIAALYAALAVGRMGVISPITAVVGASVPVVVGFASGGRPGTAATIGVALAFAAVALVSANAQTRSISLREPGVVLALVSGLGIGMVYVLLSRGRPDAAFARLACARVVSLALLTGYTLVRRERLRPERGSMRTVLAAGALDMSANVLYVLAAGSGLLAIVAVLTSLYPASTVFLARIVLRERLAALQWVGVALAGAGVMLIALSA